MRVIQSPAAASQWEQFFPRAEMTPEPGFETVLQIAAKIGLSDSQTRKLMKRLVAEEKVEQRFFRSKPNNSPVAHYRPYEKPASAGKKHRRHR
jgi:predicted ArsR family transcriptional regulator